MASLVSTNDLADRLGVTASASAMVKKLAELGLVDHALPRDFDTPDGRRLALEVLRHHRLLEPTWSSISASWDCARGGRRARARCPSTRSRASRPSSATRRSTRTAIRSCSATPSIDEGASRSLADLQAGDRGRFVRVSDSDPAMLRYLHDRGIAIGDSLEVLDVQPFEGPLTVRFGDNMHVLRRAGARCGSSLGRGPRSTARARPRGVRRRAGRRSTSRSACPVLKPRSALQRSRKSA